MATIHPTAIVDPRARLAEDVVVGPWCVVEDGVEIGEGCELRAHAIVRRGTRMGRGNLVDSFAVLGGLPQDLGFDPDSRTHLEIGNDNTFREYVTISRATSPERPTRVGSGTYWMKGAHAGHDASVADRAILVNDVALAGHTEVGERANLSASVMLHQFCWIGPLVMVRGGADVGQHVPPYVLVAGRYVYGLNRVGLQRCEHIGDEDRRQIREAFGLTYRSSLTPARAVEQMDGWADITAAAGRFRDFLRRVLQADRRHRRGILRLARRREGIE